MPIRGIRKRVPTKTSKVRKKTVFLWANAQPRTCRYLPRKAEVESALCIPGPSSIAVSFFRSRKNLEQSIGTSVKATKSDTSKEKLTVRESSRKICAANPG